LAELADVVDLPARAVAAEEMAADDAKLVTKEGGWRG
jgi:hypothetical protein